MLCPVTLQAQHCWNCFGAICCEKCCYSKHQVTEFPFTALFWGWVPAPSRLAGRWPGSCLPCCPVPSSPPGLLLPPVRSEAQQPQSRQI